MNTEYLSECLPKITVTILIDLRSKFSSTTFPKIVWHDNMRTTQFRHIQTRFPTAKILPSYEARRKSIVTQVADLASQIMFIPKMSC